MGKWLVKKEKEEEGKEKKGRRREGDEKECIPMDETVSVSADEAPLGVTARVYDA